MIKINLNEVQKLTIQVQLGEENREYDVFDIHNKIMNEYRKVQKENPNDTIGFDKESDIVRTIAGFPDTISPEQCFKFTAALQDIIDKFLSKNWKDGWMR